jgi:hypothetical protein
MKGARSLRHPSDAFDIDRVLSPGELAGDGGGMARAGDAPAGTPASRDLPGATSMRVDRAQSQES